MTPTNEEMARERTSSDKEIVARKKCVSQWLQAGGLLETKIFVSNAWAGCANESNKVILFSTYHIHPRRSHRALEDSSSGSDLGESGVSTECHQNLKNVYKERRNWALHSIVQLVSVGCDQTSSIAATKSGCQDFLLQTYKLVALQ